jgi:hypothetical protein
VKSFLQSWGSTVLIVIVILSLGILPIFQGISHSAKQLRLQQELIELYQFNGHLNTDNAIMRLQLDHANEVLDQQHDMIRGMYEQLRQWENLPPFPGEEKKPRPNRSEA